MRRIPEGVTTSGSGEVVLTGSRRKSREQDLMTFFGRLTSSTEKGQLVRWDSFSATGATFQRKKRSITMNEQTGFTKDEDFFWMEKMT